MKFISIPLFILGLLSLSNSKKISLVISQYYKAQFKQKFKNSQILDNPITDLIYRLMPLIFGVAMIVLGLHFIFGTIYINGAVPE